MLKALLTAFSSGTAAAAGSHRSTPSGTSAGSSVPGGRVLSDATVSFYSGLLLAVLVLVAGLLALAVRHERSLEEVEDVTASLTSAPRD